MILAKLICGPWHGKVITIDSVSNTLTALHSKRKYVSGVCEYVYEHGCYKPVLLYTNNSIVHLKIKNAYIYIHSKKDPKFSKIIQKIYKQYRCKNDEHNKLQRFKN